MILKWTAAWYELDQTVIVGDKALFYLSIDEKSILFNDLYQSNSFIRKRLEIMRITHPVLGNVNGIVTIGQDYSFYLADGTMLEANSEEQPGRIYDFFVVIDDWTFDVEVNVLDEADLQENDKKESLKDSVSRYKVLLGITEAPWERYV
ncbi:hypothetical protein [Ruminococcus flavefaciens]|uniref:hypothetical protein n=1 Tax=Ruminococcus flavefaciens TaxID=1265 RepID=UPI0026F1A249|nr:hypothetical protein [Ruminococcus flavefaciens]